MSNYSFDTFGNVVDEAFDELSVDGDGNSFPGLSRANMEKWANRYCKDFISRVNIKTREGTTTFTTVTDTTLSAAALSGATSLTITSATGWPSSGLAVVDGFPTTFTRSSTTLTVSAIPRDIDSGVAVQLGYALPTDFLRPRSIWVESTEYVFAKKGDSLTVPERGVAIYGDYFVFPSSTGGDADVTVHYMKKASNTLTSASTMEIMDYFDSYVILMLCARGHRIMYDNDRGAAYELQAREVMKLAKNHFAKEDGSRNNMVVPAF